MSYSGLSTVEMILLAMEFVGRDQTIPVSISEEIPSDVLWDIQNPDIQHDNNER